MRCRVDLVREALRGFGIALGAILLITGPFFAALAFWLGPLLFALGLFLLLASRRLATRWCLEEGWLCLGRRCYDLSKLKGYEVRPVGLGLCREARLYLVFEDQSVPFPIAVEEGHRLAQALFGEVPELLRPRPVPDAGARTGWDELEPVFEMAFFYLLAALADRVFREVGWGPALLVLGGGIFAVWQLGCRWNRRVKL